MNRLNEYLNILLFGLKSNIFLSAKLKREKR